MSTTYSRVTRRQFLVRATTVAVALGGASALAACGAPTAPSTTPTAAPSSPAAAGKARLKLRLGTFTAEEFINTKVARKFAEILAQKSSGEITVDVFPNAQLGGEKDLAEGVRLGTVDICMNSGVIAQWVPKWGITELPFLYRDYQHATKAMQGPILEALHPLINTAGFRILGLGPNYPRQTYSRKPIRGLDDFKGLKIRVPEVPMFVETFKALGATPTPIPAPEIYSALQTGIVDAQEGAPDWMYSLKSYEVVKNLVMTSHILNGELMIMSEALWRKQPEDVQKLIQASATEAYQWFVDQRLKEGEEGIRKLIATGMTRIDLDRAELAKAVEPVHQKFAKDQGVADLIKKVKELQ